MKAKIVLMFLSMLVAWSVCALAQEVAYTGIVTKDMTIRETKSTSGKKLGSVKQNELVHIVELEEQWTKIDESGLVGYILTKNISEIESDDYDDESNAEYVGVAAKTLTVRLGKNKSSAKLGEITEGENVYVLELGKEWHRISRRGVEGYVLASGVYEVKPLRENGALPENYVERLFFNAVYTAKADVNLSIRERKNSDSRMIGTVYENESVDVMETDGEWAFVKKGSATGYVRGDHLRYYERLDPFGPYIPGVQWYPYAAHATENTRILDSETGELLRVVPKGAVMSVTALQDDMSVLLPYDRITGRIEDISTLEMEDVHSWESCEAGELIAVFSTYYDPEMSTQRNTGRLHNIMQGVERLNGHVIASGERFSFNEFCAPYTKSNGYELGPIINYTSSTKLGYGGGICQVSTTLYDAVLQIPIQIVKWQVHSSYGISYAPLDMDAAVGAGNLDFRIENPLPYAIRLDLQAVGGVLTVRIYRAE